MNIENLKIIIESIVAFCTVATFIVIWLTLREMKTQRYKTFEPLIIPENYKSFALYDRRIFRINWAMEKSLENFSINRTTFFKIINIGQGIAKDILVTVYWNVKYHEYFNILKTEFESKNMDIKINVSEGSCWIEAKNDAENGWVGNYPFVLKKEYKFDYLLPLRDSKEFLKIEIPGSIEIMISLTIILIEAVNNEEKNEIYQRLMEYVNADMKIELKDNLDKSFSKQFRLRLTVPMVAIISEYNGVMYTIYMERESKQPTKGSSD